ncbi:MAG TPA: nucleoside-triphosphatase [Caldisericia bacterium]|nr:nucleoside-triphosphatase [Caldisericia bacterium]HQL65975.1 nucleoside-triphosphatase [Caldisericia bacterium]HQN48528.1 nucleoside-triphosphatase [Caldisericia bacterium]HQO99657.1 nucleoside-triphosphatase [Caldisericia bacterium]
MKKNIFIEGDIKVGKSYVLEKTLKILNIKYGGFKTIPIYKEDKKVAFKLIDLLTNEENVVATYNIDGNLIVNSDIFDELGVKALENGLKKSDLIVMDELGFLEDNSNKFKEKVFEVLNSDKNVLAVIKDKKNKFLNEISNLGEVFKIENDNKEMIINKIVDEVRNGYL